MYKEKLEDLTYNNVTATGEKKGNKIKITLESDIYSNEVFAVSPYYDEGEEKNKLQEIKFNLKVTEKNGKVEVIPEFQCTHYTTGHSQINNPKKFFKDKKDLAVYEVLKLDEEYFLQDDRMQKLLNMWENEPEFKEHLEKLIAKRKISIKQEKIKKTMESIKRLNKELENLISG